MKMRGVPTQILGYRIWVLLGILVLSVVLGILNNSRVYPERRVVLFGGPDYYEDEDVEEGVK